MPESFMGAKKFNSLHSVSLSIVLFDMVIETAIPSYLLDKKFFNSFLTSAYLYKIQFSN